MKKSVALLALVVSLIGFGGEAKADPVKVGLQWDAGIPDGIAIGADVRPGLNWLRLNLSGTDNILNYGVRGGFTLDPIKFGITPTLSGELGHNFDGSLPGVSNSPAISYTYANAHLGLEFGNRDRFRFFLRGGVSYLDLRTSGFQNTVQVASLQLSDPKFTGFVAPTGKLGFVIFFN